MFVEYIYFKTNKLLLFSIQVGRKTPWLVPTQDPVYESMEPVFLELHATAMLCLPSGEWMAPDATLCTTLMSALYSTVTEEEVVNRQLMVCSSCFLGKRKRDSEKFWFFIEYYFISSSFSTVHFVLQRIYTVMNHFKNSNNYLISSWIVKLFLSECLHLFWWFFVVLVALVNLSKWGKWGFSLLNSLVFRLLV